MLRADRGVYRWNRVWSRSVRETNDGVCLTGLCVVYVREGANSLHPHLTLSCLPGATQLQVCFLVLLLQFHNLNLVSFSFVGVSFTQRAHCFLFFIRRKQKNNKKNPKTKLHSTSCQTLHLRSLQRHLRKQCNTCNTLAISKGFSWLFLRLQLQFHSQRMPNVGPSIRRSTVFWLSSILLPW